MKTAHYNAQGFTADTQSPIIHLKGNHIEKRLTASEAIVEAGLDWEVKKEPCYTQDGKQIKNHHAVVRQDSLEALSIVGNRYTPIQNKENLSFFDDVVGEGQAIYTSAGSVYGGELVFLTASLNGRLFLKNRPEDELEKQVFLSNRHSSKGCLVIQILTHRFACLNKLSALLKSRPNQIRIRHSANWAGRRDEARKVLGLCSGYFDDLQAVINSLDDQPVSQSGIVSFAEQVIPAEQDENNRIRPSVVAARNSIVNLFSNGKGNLGKSRWDALNAVTEYVDHEQKVRGGNTAEGRFVNATFGGGVNLKNRAFELLTA